MISLSLSLSRCQTRKYLHPQFVEGWARPFAAGLFQQTLMISDQELKAAPKKVSYPDLMWIRILLYITEAGDYALIGAQELTDIAEYIDSFISHTPQNIVRLCCFFPSLSHTHTLFPVYF
jgi:hypothetical protein